MAPRFSSARSALLLILGFLLSCTLLACGGGGGGTTPPVTAPIVNGVSPSGATAAGGSGGSITFTATIGNTPTSFSWNFGGGATPNTSTSSSPAVTLGAPGTYTGTLMASNTAGSSATFTFSFTVTGPVPVITSVSPAGAIGNPGGSATFSATATNSPTGFAWSFGGGATPNTSSETTPVVTLGAVGTYTGSVIAANANGNSTAFTFSFTVTDVPQPPVISAVSPIDVAGHPGEAVTFTVSASNSPTGFAWSFGTGATPATSGDAAPVVTLGAEGTYSGTVTVTNAVGASAPFSFTYIVLLAPTITAVNGVSFAGSPIRNYTVVATGSPTSYTWDFGTRTDPGTFTESDPEASVTLLQLGVATATVTATNAEGTSAPFTFNATLAPWTIDVHVTWNDFVDVDLYVYEPGGETCWRGHQTTANGGQHSGDDANGNGPESYHWEREDLGGQHNIRIHYFSDNGALVPASGTVQIVFNEGLAGYEHSESRTFFIQEPLSAAEGPGGVGPSWADPGRFTWENATINWN